jgi:hypothetical protein
MKKLIPILLLMLFSTPVMAVEPITGAFGFKLGDVWDGEATKTWEGDGYFTHDFIPDSPLDAFEFYWVAVTPVKGLIFTIKASKDGSCNSQLLAFKNALTKKYGSGKGSLYSHIWTQGNRTIELSCRRNIFTLTYDDRAIYKSRLDELAEQVDTSNL